MPRAKPLTDAQAEDFTAAVQRAIDGMGADGTAAPLAAWRSAFAAQNAILSMALSKVAKDAWMEGRRQERAEILEAIRWRVMKP
jgi:hypothetical protein